MAPRRRGRCLGLGPLYVCRARSARDSILRARDLSGSRDDPDHGALHGAGRARHRHAMQHEGRQDAIVAARGSFFVEWLRPVPATAHPTESHLSHLIPLNPGKSRIRINVWPKWDGGTEPLPGRDIGAGAVLPKFIRFRPCTSSLRPQSLTPSCPDSFRASPSARRDGGAWMAGTSPAMTRRGHLANA